MTLKYEKLLGGMIQVDRKSVKKEDVPKDEGG